MVEARLPGYEQLLHSGEFSDFLVTCNGHEFNLHRAILVSRSDYFQKMITGNFKEAATCEVDIPDIDPALLARAISFFYCDKYSPDQLGVSDFARFYDMRDEYGSTEADKIQLLHAEMYIVATRLCDDALQEYAKCRLIETIADRSRHRKVKRRLSPPVDCCSSGLCEFTPADAKFYAFIYAHDSIFEQSVFDVILLSLAAFMKFHRGTSYDLVAKTLEAIPKLAMDLCKAPLITSIVRCEDCHSAGYYLSRRRCDCDRWIDACENECKTPPFYCWECFHELWLYPDEF